MDYDGRLRAWAKAGGRGSGLPRPRRRLAPSAQDLRTISLWAVLIQVMGMLGFNMATVCTLVGHAVALDVSGRPSPGFAVLPAVGILRCSACAPVAIAQTLHLFVSTRRSPLHPRMLQEHVRRWTVKFGFTFGGAAFTGRRPSTSDSSSCL